VGKQVWGSGAGLGVTRDGTHAQYVAVGLNSLSEKPSHLSMTDAAAVGVPYLAAWSALAVMADIQPGETILVTGALGAVGRAATQIAHWKKARVIGADMFSGSSDADVLLNTKEGDLVAEVRGLTEGRGADLVLDTVGGPMFEPCLQSLRVGGRQVAIASIGNGRVEFSLVDFYHRSQRLIGVDTLKFTGPQIAKIMNDLRAGFEDGHLRISALRTWSLNEAVDAYNAVAGGDGSKKHIILPRRK
jgi:NADPH:quinone reductase-like Zn-dependent oxidoreductase